jgi:hypothetical protein
MVIDDERDWRHKRTSQNEWPCKWVFSKRKWLREEFESTGGRTGVLFYPEDEHSMVLRNFEFYLPNYTVKCPKWP